MRPRDVAAYTALVDMGNGSGRIRMTFGRISEATGFPRSEVDDLLARLQVAGLLDVALRSDGAVRLTFLGGVS